MNTSLNRGVQRKSMSAKWECLIKSLEHDNYDINLTKNNSNHNHNQI